MIFQSGREVVDFEKIGVKPSNYAKYLVKKYKDVVEKFDQIDTEEAKLKYMLEDVKKIHETGQPILIGTVAVESSEVISKLLTKAHIKHDVLNAKNHAREAEIIANAGQLGAVTIATNMAGRGTDIKLGEGVKELGGLAIIGTERHESRRIDNQLRGRSGRQGDPGFSRFYISADDELLVRFGGDSFKQRIKSLVTMTSGDVNLPLESRMFSNVVTNAQKRIEGNNFDSRKNVLKYDEVLSKQRTLFYTQRRDVILKEDISTYVNSLIENCIENICDMHMEEVGHNRYRIDDEGLYNAFNGPIFPQGVISLEKIKDSAYYLRYEHGKYYAHIEPTINSVLARIRGTIEHSKVVAKLRSVANSLIKETGTFAVVNPITLRKRTTGSTIAPKVK